MKFIRNLKIFITIFALIQLSYTSKLESKSSLKTSTEVKNNASITAKAEMKTDSKNKLKSEANLGSSLKLKTESKNKIKTESSSKLNLKLKNKNSSNRSGIIDMNNLFNPNFDNSKKENSEKDGNNKNNNNNSSNGDNQAPQKNTDQILSDWLMISSEAFRDKSKFPDIYIRQTREYLKIRVDNMDFRINDAHDKDTDQGENAPKNANCFWFRLSGLNIYYSSTVSDINVLGSISIASVVGLINLENDHSGYFCFIIKDNSGIEWKVCSTKVEKRNTWVCAIQTTLGTKKESFCNGAEKKEVVKIIDHNVN